MAVYEYGHGSGWTFTPAYATVQLGGRPGAVLTFGCGPTAGPLWDAGGVVLYQIGPHSFEIEQCISPAYQRSWTHLDLRPGSEFAPLVGGFEARTPEDAIRDYDLLVTAVGRLPRSGTFKGRSGTEYRYTIR